MLSPAQEEIIDRFRHPRFAGEVGEPDIVAEGSNPVCGDEVRITIKLQEGAVEQIRHASRACAICTASTDLLCERLEGRSLDPTQFATDQIEERLGIPLSPIRLKCALLPIEALKSAMVADES